MTGKVYLIGAGCGDHDLITLRGLRLLEKCSCIIYDALIDERLLGFAPESAELICVGKRSGHHSAKQEVINALIVEKALGGKTVARLKGGDPFVFGRGGEEILALKEHGIPYAVVPGISSSVAVGELAGIPVTHRRLSRSFHVITGHIADGGENFAKYAQLGGTLVFLMGLSHIGRIAESLIAGGLSPETPAAVVSNGATSEQKAVRSTLANIVSDSADCEAPAVIIVGETAAFDFSPTIKLPLTGTKIAVTGTKNFTHKLAAQLEPLGAQVYLHSHIRIVQKGEIPPLDGYGCIAFTSVNGANRFIEHIRRERIDMRSLAGLKFAAVGSGTASALAEVGIYADIIPEVFTVAELAKAIAANIGKGERLLILRAENGSRELNEILSENGVVLDDIKLYDTVPCTKELPRAIDCDYIVFGSSFGVKTFFENSSVGESAKIVCIGTKAAEAAEKYTVNKILTAAPHTSEGAVKAIMEDNKK